MGWQADHDAQPGEEPGRGVCLPELLAGFEHGGVWAGVAPSAALAGALEAAAGPDDLYEGADTDALVGIARQWAAVESWAAAGLMGSLRAMMREDSGGRPLLRRRSDLPEGWDDSLNYEVAAALAMGPISAGNLAGLAWTLGVRLPGIGRLLADGTLTRAKAKLIAATFEPLNDGEAARAEALIVADLAGKTYFQVERLAWRAALAVAPDVAERRRVAAERERARVTVFREESGAVGLSGRGLPASQALSGHASVVARAREYEASGAFSGQTTNSLQALAYLHLLNGVTAADAIAFARAAGAEPPVDDDSGDQGDGGPRDEGGGGAGDPGDCGGREGNPEPGRPDAPGGGPFAGRAAPEPAADERPAGDSGTDSPCEGGGGSRGGPGGDAGDRAAGGSDGRSDRPGAGGGNVVLPEVTVPLAALQRRAERPGDSRLLGPLDPALARDLAAAAACSPGSRWEVTVVDDHGYAVGHGIARPRRGERQPPPIPGPASRPLPARVNITVTESLLRQLEAQEARAAQQAQPRSGAPPGAWEFWPRTTDNHRDAWTLTLPGGRPLTVRFDVVPTDDCDHRYQADGYEPGERLRRLVQVRDQECTFPPCSRPARESDFEHAVPYDKGGPTRATQGLAADDVTRSNSHQAGPSPNPSPAGTHGPPRPAAPTFRSPGGTSPEPFDERFRRCWPAVKA